MPSGLKSSDTRIHPTAFVESGAEFGVGVEVGPFAIIGANVRIGDRTKIGAHNIINGRTTIGEDNEFKPFGSIGAQPQDLKYKGEDAELVIGNRNSFREYVNLSIGTDHGGGVTRIGDGNLVMVYTHVAHDCIVGDGCIFANGVSLAGHVEVHDLAVLGGHAAVHQFCKIGMMAMVAGGAMVTQDVPPFTMVHGDRAEPKGLNLTGLRRHETMGEWLADIKAMYRQVYSEQRTIEEAISAIESEVPPSDARTLFVDFLKASQRGVCR